MSTSASTKEGAATTMATTASGANVATKRAGAYAATAHLPAGDVLVTVETTQPEDSYPMYIAVPKEVATMLKEHGHCTRKA